VRTADTLKAARLRNVMRQELLALMEDVDILAVPTTPTTAFAIESFPGRDDLVATTTSLTLPFNVLGVPAISVPCGFDSNGLPIGLMLAGRHWEDELVLRAGYAFEQAATHGYAASPVASSL
jgi:aspartyl-tRNA(Asn)/glutamyl-tRNA(Gln) amidotransferase subunit A